MDLMIQDLLDVTRWEGGPLDLRCESVDLQRYLDDLFHWLSLSMETSRIHLDLPADIPPVSADYAWLERILVNLLSNALKYSAPSTPVTLHAWRKEEHVVVAVSDQGRGITPEELPHMFERFYRTTGTRKTEGIGLIPYISRILIDAHGGHL